MKKYFPVAIVIVVALIIVIYFKYSKTPDMSGDGSVILFYGRECPHCQTVEEYIEKNKIAEKVEFTRAEIFHNSNNQKIFVEKNKTCGITDEKEMGVPFLWTDGKCIIGQDKIIEYFQSGK